MTGLGKVRKPDEGRNARRTLDAADRMRQRADEMAKRAFTRLFGDAPLREKTEPAEFAAAFRLAERYEREGEYASAGGMFATLLCGRMDNKPIAGKLAWRGALNYLRAGMLNEAFHAFGSAIRNSPEGKERMARSAAERFITFAKEAHGENKHLGKALALKLAADLLKGIDAKRASRLYEQSGCVYLTASSQASSAMGCFARAAECDPARAEKLIEGAVASFMSMIRVLEGGNETKEAAYVSRLAAELRGKIRPELAHPLYLKARALYEAAGDGHGAADMCSKAADSIAEREPAEAARLKVKAGELLAVHRGVDHHAANEFAAAAKLLELVDPAASLDLHIRAGDIYTTAENQREDEVERYFKEAKAEYAAATRLAQQHAPGRLLELGAKKGCLIAEAERAGHTLE
ncbi:MAG: hypothetical protein AB1657_02300 [Candidatus Micrarchaeota archaeon]